METVQPVPLTDPTVERRGQVEGWQTGFFALPPERRRRLALAVVLAVVGATCLVIGWIRVAGTRDVSEQLSFFASGTIVGLVLIAFAGATLVSDFMAEQTRATDELQRQLAEVRSLVAAGSNGVGSVRGSVGVPTHSSTSGSQSAMATTMNDGIGFGDVAHLPESSRVHQPNCALVAGKPNVEFLRADEAASRGLKPCGTCRPPVGNAFARS